VTLNLRKVYIILKKAELEMKFKLKNLKYFSVDYYRIRGEVVPDVSFWSHHYLYTYIHYIYLIISL